MDTKTVGVAKFGRLTVTIELKTRPELFVGTSSCLFAFISASSCNSGHCLPATLEDVSLLTQSLNADVKNPVIHNMVINGDEVAKIHFTPEMAGALAIKVNLFFNKSIVTSSLSLSTVLPSPLQLT